MKCLQPGSRFFIGKKCAWSFDHPFWSSWSLDFFTGERLNWSCASFDYRSLKVTLVCTSLAPRPLSEKWRSLGHTWGSHLYVLCRSVCDQDQNWIKRSKPFLRADQGIKTTSKLQKSKDQCDYSLTFDPLNIKQSRASEGNNQMIKHNFWSWSQTLQQVAYKWLPLKRPIEQWILNYRISSNVWYGNWSCDYYVQVLVYQMVAGDWIGCGVLLHSWWIQLHLLPRLPLPTHSTHTHMQHHTLVPPLSFYYRLISSIMLAPLVYRLTFPLLPSPSLPFPPTDSQSFPPLQLSWVLALLAPSSLFWFKWFYWLTLPTPGLKLGKDLCHSFIRPRTATHVHLFSSDVFPL